MGRSNTQIAMRVSLQTVAVNSLLTLVKLAAGVLSRSPAMLSDTVHSASDVLSTFVVMIGVKMAAKSSDKEHNYGHERMESVAAILLSVMLFFTGAGIGYSSILRIIGHRPIEMNPYGGLALGAAALSILVKETMYWYTRAAARQTGSSALMADAWHHRSDALSSIGSFAGILGASLGFPMLDPLAGCIISLFILKAACEIFMSAVGKMTDKACDEVTVEKMRGLILSDDSVLELDSLKTRLFGDKIYVDLEISVDAASTLLQAHAVAQRVHDNLEQNFPTIKHCMVHVNPAGV